MDTIYSDIRINDHVRAIYYSCEEFTIQKTYSLNPIFGGMDRLRAVKEFWDAYGIAINNSYIVKNFM